MNESPEPASRRIPWYAWPFLPFCYLVFLPLLLLLGVLALLSLLLGAPMMAVQAIDERRFRRLMKQRNRFVEWADLAPALMRGEGTLLVEQANKRPVRVWWTPEAVPDLAPCPPPDEDELDVMGLRPNQPHQFVAWCHRRYTSPATGRAIITVPSLRLPPGLFFASFFREQFPRLRAIDTVYCRGE